MKNKVLLIGGNGYIGSRLYEYLLNRFDVTNVDICWNIPVVHIDIKGDYNKLSKVFINKFDYIILLAAHSSVKSVGNRLLPALKNNVLNVIDLVEKINDDQILIFASTAAIYGNNDFEVDETYPISNPSQFYDLTKFNCESAFKIYNKPNIIILRFGTLGGFSKNFRIENLMNSISYKSIVYNKIDLSNINYWRSVLGLNDLCRAMVRMMEIGQFKNNIYNLNSFNIKIGDVGNEIQKLTGCDFAINDSMSTSYSFNCSNKRFCNEFEFKFNDTVESIFDDVKLNLQNILVKDFRNEQYY